MSDRSFESPLEGYPSTSFPYTEAGHGVPGPGPLHRHGHGVERQVSR
jgi:hypothetical protein